MAAMRWETLDLLGGVMEITLPKRERWGELGVVPGPLGGLDLGPTRDLDFRA